MKNKNKKITLCILVVLIIIFGILFFNAKSQNIEEKTLARNIEYKGEKVSLIEKLEKKEGKTSLILKDKEGRKKIDEFLKNNEIPVEIVDTFLFKTEKDEYIIATILSYVRVNNEVFQQDGYNTGIYIYDSSYNRMHYVEQEFYIEGPEKSFYEFDFNNKDLIMKKLEELEEEGKL